MKVEIRAWREEDWPALASFIDQHWSRGHPVSRLELFDWQYQGFGASLESPAPASLLAFDREGLAGFLGLIPGLYQLQCGAEARVVEGHALAMWAVRSELRGSGLGLRLLAKAESLAPVTLCLGANAEAARYYRRRGYRACERLTRWVAPLEARSYAELCAAPAAAQAIEGAARKILAPRAIAPAAFEPEALEALWRRSTRGASGGPWAIQALHRTARFFEWRYLEAPADEEDAYHCFGEPPAGAALIARLETVEGRDLQALRVIEALPSSPEAWRMEPDAELSELLRGAAAWAREEGAAAMDFQVSGRLLSPTLERAGLRPQQDPPCAEPLTSLAAIFRPLFLEKPPINVFWRLPAEADADALTPWYAPKSDGDMDRPHALSAHTAPNAAHA